MVKMVVEIPVYTFVQVVVELEEEEGEPEDELEYRAIESQEATQAVDGVYENGQKGISPPYGVSLSWGGSDQVDWDKATAYRLED